MLAAALAIGAWLRLDQLVSQVLIEDEWHAVHQLLYYSPKQVLLSFGHADYGIPLVLLYFVESSIAGLTELQLRLPMLIAGIATVVALPAMLRGRIEDQTLAVFGLLLAVSPILVSYSRIARPYAVTLLGIYFAYWLFERAVRHARVDWKIAWGYSIVSGLIVWMHAVTGPMLVVPLVAAWWEWLRRRDETWRPLVGLTALAGLFMALAVLPPLLGDPDAIAGKSGIDTVTIDTVIGAWYLYAGTGSFVVACTAAFLAAVGFTAAWRSSPIVRWIWLGAGLTVVALLVSRPWWVNRPLAFARYLLPLLPAVLLSISAGLVRAWSLVMQRLLKRPESLATTWGAAAFLLVIGWTQFTPYPDILRRPNSYTQHSYFQLDYRNEKNGIRVGFSTFFVSPFWSTLASAPSGTLTVAIAPFQYATYEWPAPLWERASGQRVIPAYLWGACGISKAGEVPPDARFRFRNAIHVVDPSEWRENRVDYIAYSKIPPQWEDPPAPECEPWMRRSFGPAYYEDLGLIVWKLSADPDKLHPAD